MDRWGVGGWFRVVGGIGALRGVMGGSVGDGRRLERTRLHDKLERRVVLEGRVGRATAGREVSDPLRGDSVDTGGCKSCKK